MTQSVPDSVIEAMAKAVHDDIKSGVCSWRHCIKSALTAAASLGWELTKMGGGK